MSESARIAIWVVSAYLTGMYALGSVLVCAGGTLGGYAFERHVTTELESDRSYLMVIVAARDLEPGVTITEEDLYAVEIQTKYVPAEGVFLTPDAVVGTTATELVLANEFVRTERVAR